MSLGGECWELMDALRKIKRRLYRILKTTHNLSALVGASGALAKDQKGKLLYNRPPPIKILACFMTEKHSNSTSWQTYKRLLAYLKGLQLPFAVSVFGYLLFAATQPMLAKLMEVIIEAIQNKDLDARWSLPFMAVGIFAVRGVGSFLGD